jgi:hypothetical protein
MERIAVINLVNTTKLLPVMEAWLRGEKIQFANFSMFNGWKDWEGDSPEFEREDLSWRIKPIPRSWWIAIYNDGSMRIDNSAVRDGTEAELIKVQEVLQ